MYSQSEIRTVCFALVTVCLLLDPVAMANEMPDASKSWEPGQSLRVEHLYRNADAKSREMKRQADLGDPVAAGNLAYQLQGSSLHFAHFPQYPNMSAEELYSEFVHYAMKAYELGSKALLSTYADDMLRRGRPQHTATARLMLDGLVARGDLKAKLSLANHHLDGVFSDSTPEMGERMMREVAESRAGIAEGAMRELASRMRECKGLPQDIARSVYWLKRMEHACFLSQGDLDHSIAGILCDLVDNTERQRYTSKEWDAGVLLFDQELLDQYENGSRTAGVGLALRSWE